MGGVESGWEVYATWNIAASSLPRPWRADGH
jgi:hypothetical protein